MYTTAPVPTAGRLFTLSKMINSPYTTLNSKSSLFHCSCYLEFVTSSYCCLLSGVQYIHFLRYGIDFGESAVCS